MLIKCYMGRYAYAYLLPHPSPCTVSAAFLARVCIHENMVCMTMSNVFLMSYDGMKYNNRLGYCCTYY